MERATLRQDIIKKIKVDPVITGYLAKLLTVHYRTLLRYLDENDAQLTQWSVLKMLQAHFGIMEMENLIEEHAIAA